MIAGSSEAVARSFMAMALLYAIAGLIFGLQMAISNNHGQMTTHVHINLIGWVSFFLFALFYRLFAANVPTILARIHFWLAQVSALGIFVGIGMIHAGQTQFEPLAAISSIAYAISFLVFAVVAYRGFVKQN